LFSGFSTGQGRTSPTEQNLGEHLFSGICAPSLGRPAPFRLPPFDSLALSLPLARSLPFDSLALSLGGLPSCPASSSPAFPAGPSPRRRRHGPETSLERLTPWPFDLPAKNPRRGGQPHAGAPEGRLGPAPSLLGPIRPLQPLSRKLEISHDRLKLSKPALPRKPLKRLQNPAIVHRLTLRL
jgi:hypothetical protein